MTGLEKIIEKIDYDCKITCEDIISKAQAEAQVILDNAKIAGEKAKSEIIEAAKAKNQTQLDMAVSRAEHERKKAILAAKISIINDIIGESMQKLKTIPQDDYFDAIKKLVLLYAQKGNGVLSFSKNDLNRMPQNFEASANEMLKGTDKSVTISKEPVSIDDGFIITYGDIEQNCTFDALLHVSMDEIKDALYKAIFTRESV